MGSYPGKQLVWLSALLPTFFLLRGPTWTWEPIGLRESAVRFQGLEESGWAKAFNGELEPIISILFMPGFLRAEG